MAESALTLPGPLAGLLQELGYEWPKSNEAEIFDLGRRWVEFGEELREIHGRGERHAETAISENQGLDTDMFNEQFAKVERGARVLEDGATGAMVVGSGLSAAATLVLGLKISILAQVALLQAQIASVTAAAAASPGASLPLIRQAKRHTASALDRILADALNALER